jgi:hypothetical protein
MHATDPLRHRPSPPMILLAATRQADRDMLSMLLRRGIGGHAASGTPLVR